MIKADVQGKFDGETMKVEITWSRAGITYRVARAEMLCVSALIELASEGEKWCVNVPDNIANAGKGRLMCSIEIEPFKGDVSEMARMRKVIESVVARCASSTKVLPV